MPNLPDDFDIRDLASQDDYERAEEIQRVTWGRDFTECVPVTILMISQKVGGVAAGAFAPDGEMHGFVFGLSGVREGALTHWSHMLAVTSEAQGHGLGRRMKLFQRERLLSLGIGLCYWTYDPLVAQNAHLNINRLGARPDRYVTDMYGSDTKSELHSGLGTDRFIVKWDLESPDTARALLDDVPDHASWSTTPSVDATDNDGVAALESGAPIRIEIPDDIQVVKNRNREEAMRWRTATRASFTNALERGYRVVGFHRDRATGRCFYQLDR